MCNREKVYYMAHHLEVQLKNVNYGVISRSDQLLEKGAKNVTSDPQ